MSEFMYDKEKYIKEGEQIIFENNTDSSFGVETGIVFHKSGLYDVDICNNHVVVSKVDERKAIQEVYQKGFEAGSHEATTLEFQCGLDYAWEAITKIALLPYTQRSETFDGQQDILSIVQKFSPSEALAKLKAYEEQQKADEIKVSDIITDGKINYLVIDITDKSYVALQGTDFEPSYIGKDYIKSYHNLHDSKDMRKIAEEINKAVKSEQKKVCATCKYEEKGTKHSVCYSCLNQNRWELKEGAE